MFVIYNPATKEYATQSPDGNWNTTSFRYLAIGFNTAVEAHAVMGAHYSDIKPSMTVVDTKPDMHDPATGG